MIDQISALKSLEKALLPASLLIDGRTERDMLCFLTDFASLINFYDNTNTVNGTWEPFLFKDPVFLLASISKTDFKQYQSLYIDICLKLEQWSGSDIRSNIVMVDLVNQLFDLLIKVFKQIERWTYYMQSSAPQYSLKTYVLDQVKNNISIYFWAVIALRDRLSRSSPISEIDPVNYYEFDGFDKIIWKQNKDKTPYWQVLGPDDLEDDLKINTMFNFWGVFNGLKKAGDVLFNFFGTIITQADLAYQNQSVKKSSFPDTTLLRTFVHLLKNHQEQLNAISQKHLQFYYKDILRQTIKPAIADSVFVYATLTKHDAVFKLPAGTLLNAGIDADKNPILFATERDTDINPAVITSAYTLNKVIKGKLASLYLKSIPTPGIIQQDTSGKTLAWETFGSSVTATSTPAKIGIAFASPLFLLREGSRKIIVMLNFTTAIDPQMLIMATYYLSTAEAWLTVTPSFQANKIADTVTQFIVEIDLNAAQPPIEPFVINPDGLQSVWPMLKIEFSSFTNTQTAPVLKSINVEVNVLNVSTFQLYNDYGAVSTKTPYPLWGPVPAVNAGFIIGNNEIFSKPVNELGIELNWNNLPDDFANYYNQYNNYLNPPKPVVPEQEEKSFIGKVLDYIKDKPDTVPVVVDPNAPNPEPIFNNCSFGVDFKMLQPKGWTNLKVSTQMVCTAQNCTTECIYKQQIQNPLPGDPPLPSTLFSTSCNAVKPGGTTEVTHTLSNSSFFSFDNNGTLPCNPNLQLTPLKFEETSDSGFMKMTLATPAYGFGSEVYPKVVASIATANALTVYEIANDKDTEDQDKKKAEIIQPANPPFAPIVNNLVAHYSASQEYVFDHATGTYPIQCFLYAPFQNQVVYDSTQANTNAYYSVDITEPITGGIPLFPAVNYSGYLFLGMDNLVPANSINLYFEFNRKYGINNNLNKQISYSYLAENGWEDLSVLYDGTNGLTCSGILQLNVPDDISNQNTAMPDGKYWFAAKVNDPSSYADTIFVTTNGFIAKRSGSLFSADTVSPHLASNAITKLQTLVPQIATVVQPFPSFGGKPAENETGMNQRVSSRLKTKDRAVNAEDYYRLIKHQNPEIYYSKAVFNKVTRTTNVYLVKRSRTDVDPDAYKPMITECKEASISKFLNERASTFAGVTVSNFNFLCVCITATITIDTGFEPKGLQKTINDALNLFLSPWIISDQVQLTIDQGITDTIVAKFLRSINGVAGVKSVTFKTGTDEVSINTAEDQHSVKPTTDDLLIVSCMGHQIIIEQ
ncbi:hypothetical protein [Mucilaginibacter jinjuensis]|uniref:Baseplate J-like protein n=1 Tax=Mucilaginibacter jinjuensis TaxID=1176721 RepID=A0ABY7T0R0_9SPHI|nr:hypothetical protein [Mucilaginibacter jinjuensis]WCT10022.1 hypothetical protein PQO05_14915 [Mucilaginibacter jinjuensis]